MHNLIWEWLVFPNIMEHVILYSSRISLSVLALSNAVGPMGFDEDESDKQ